MTDEMNTSVNYTVKELLGGINDKLDGLDIKLDRKADEATVRALEKRVGVLEDSAVRVGAVEEDRRSIVDQRRWLIALGAGVLLAPPVTAFFFKLFGG